MLKIKEQNLLLLTICLIVIKIATTVADSPGPAVADSPGPDSPGTDSPPTPTPTGAAVAAPTGTATTKENSKGLTDIVSSIPECNNIAPCKKSIVGAINIKNTDGATKINILLVNTDNSKSTIETIDANECLTLSANEFNIMIIMNEPMKIVASGK